MPSLRDERQRPTGCDLTGRLVVLNGRLDGVKRRLGARRGSVVEAARGPMQLRAGRLDIDAYFAGDESAVAGLCSVLEGS